MMSGVKRFKEELRDMIITLHKLKVAVSLQNESDGHVCVLIQYFVCNKMHADISSSFSSSCFVFLQDMKGKRLR